jgi:Erythromycin biosynthesis protein CIII-like, C-terminal domain/Erythromycin biosynthesis protein CIII-like, N-terminal domain
LGDLGRYDMCPTIVQAGIPAISAGLSNVDWREQRNRRMRDLAGLSPAERTDQLAPWMFGEILAPPMLDDLLSVVRSWPPTLFIHDNMEFAAPIAAAAIGAVHISHSFGPLTPEYRILDIAASVSPLWEAAGTNPRPHGGIYDHLYLDIYPPSIQPTLSAHVARRQPIRPTPYAPPVDGVPAILTDDARPLVYATFGTELPDQRPLKTVVDAISPLDVRVLATIGPRGSLDAFGPRLENVTIRRYVPQTAVLPHAAVVVSHAGSGTVLAALAAGVPQLCLPRFADQPLNASAVADTGAGVTLGLNMLDHHAIRESVIRLLTEDGFRSRALALRDEIAAMPSPADVAALLPEFVYA